MTRELGALSAARRQCVLMYRGRRGVVPSTGSARPCGVSRRLTWGFNRMSRLRGNGRCVPACVAGGLCASCVGNVTPRGRTRTVSREETKCRSAQTAATSRAYSAAPWYLPATALHATQTAHRMIHADRVWPCPPGDLPCHAMRSRGCRAAKRRAQRIWTVPTVEVRVEWRVSGVRSGHRLPAVRYGGFTTSARDRQYDPTRPCPAVCLRREGGVGANGGNMSPGRVSEARLAYLRPIEEGSRMRMARTG